MPRSRESIERHLARERERWATDPAYRERKKRAKRERAQRIRRERQNGQRRAA